jgi:hypothetical protein
VLVSVPEVEWPALVALLNGSACPHQELGRVIKQPQLQVMLGAVPLVDLPVADLREAHEEAIPRRLAGHAVRQDG